jgi:hypothetical protein
MSGSISDITLKAAREVLEAAGQFKKSDVKKHLSL